MKPEYEPLDEIRKCKTIQGIVDFLRERAAYSAQNMGNAAAMRDALNKVGNAAAWIAENCNDQQTAKYMNDMIAIVQIALSAPARNCDIYSTPYEARKAFNEWLKKAPQPMTLGGWLYAPAAERKGADDDKSSTPV